MSIYDAYLPRDPEEQRQFLEALRMLVNHSPSEAVADIFRSAYGGAKIWQVIPGDTSASAP
ncbi:MAG: hypothetical protein HY420_02590 [Candidatus Kerfeldbacteria bacterium]|nr:hypothetical protein [Candidatus Kerfeldbacteria bacterium]